MPRLKRRSKRRTAGYTEWHVKELQRGSAWPFLDKDEAFHGDAEALKAGWEDLRDTILRQWIAEQPGTRPWAWWAFDAPERRRCVSGVHPFDHPGREKRIAEWRATHPAEADAEAYKLNYGRPNCLIHSDDFSAVYEPEASYLERLGLMDDDERRRATEPAGEQGESASQHGG